MNTKIKTLLDQQIYINTENFFLNLSIRLGLNLPTTKKQIKEIHENILNEKKDLDDYSRTLQKAYFDYLNFLKIPHSFD